MHEGFVEAPNARTTPHMSVDGNALSRMFNVWHNWWKFGQARFIQDEAVIRDEAGLMAQENDMHALFLLPLDQTVRSLCVFCSVRHNLPHHTLVRNEQRP
jgi:hypothetical protein